MGAELKIDIVNDVADFQLFKNDKVHVVCSAYGGLTFCDTYARKKGMTQDEVWKLTQKCNDLNEVGTFYPTLNLTVIPLARWGKRDVKSFDLENFYYKHLLEVIKCHNDYVKIDYIHFIFDDPRNVKENIEYKQLEKLLLVENKILNASTIRVFNMK